MNETLITILMPCKDPHLGFFEAALQSVYAQRSPQWYLTVIDDHSEDKRVVEFLHQLRGTEDPRIRVLPNESRFVTGALNTGMRHAQTPFVCSLHCDDLLDETAIEVLSSYITASPEIDFFHSSRLYIDADGKAISSVRRSAETFTLDDFKRKGPVKHLQCWRIAMALQIGGMDESLGLHGADDYDFVWCMAEAGCVFRGLPECLYYYRDHRAHYRLTTHVPLQTQLHELRKIWTKHGMTEDEIAVEIATRTNDYLRQALYHDDADKARKTREQFDIRQGWRIPYQ